jgi:tetratricopeptide (TPR) repeat protein
MPRWSGAVLVVLWLVGVPVRAQDAPEKPPEAAQEPSDTKPRAEEPSDETRQKARAAYARGQQHFHAGRYEEAEEAFKEAYALIPNPLVMLGIAETREARGDTEGAVRALEHYLQKRAGAPDRERIEARIAELLPRPAVVRVETTPPGATIYLDGEPTSRTTPASIEVEPGEHAIDAVLEGYMPARASIDAMSGGRHEITGELQPHPDPDAGRQEDEQFGSGGALEEVSSDPKAPGDGADDKAIPVSVWVSAGVSAGALVTGTVLGFLALQQQKEFEQNPSLSVANRGERFALFADLTLGIALGAAVTALVLYLTRDGGKKKGQDDAKKASVDVAPAAAPGGGGLSARIRF